MANWILKLRVGNDRLAFNNGEIDLRELVGRYAKKLNQKVDYVRKAYGNDLADEAEDIAQDFAFKIATRLAKR